MPPGFSGVRPLFPAAVDWDRVKALRGDVPFADNVVAFLGALSAKLLKDREAIAYPDVATFAFFCRRANLQRLKTEYAAGNDRIGRGLVFHIAPGNVPINFAFSLAAGLLSGNANVVRVSSNEFPQVDIVSRTIAELSGEHADVAERIVLVRYDRDSEATSSFSALCDVRIVWGGDDTISRIRQSPLGPRAFDVTFADRYSIAVLGAEAILAESNIDRVAESFYNDAFLFDQNACSAPHLLLWLGKRDRVEKAQALFWASVHKHVEKRKYALEPVMAVNKLTTLLMQSVAMPVKRQWEGDNLIWRTELDSLSNNIDEYRCVGGYFSEFAAESFEVMAPIIDRRYQTLAYFGVSADDLRDSVIRNRLPGIDRIVPLGEGLAFALTWDGYDLIRTLTRVVATR